MDAEPVTLLDLVCILAFYGSLFVLDRLRFPAKGLANARVECYIRRLEGRKFYWRRMLVREDIHAA